MHWVLCTRKPKLEHWTVAKTHLISLWQTLSRSMQQAAVPDDDGRLTVWDSGLYLLDMRPKDSRVLRHLLPVLIVNREQVTSREDCCSTHLSCCPVWVIEDEAEAYGRQDWLVPLRVLVRGLRAPTSVQCSVAAQPPPTPQDTAERTGYRWTADHICKLRNEGIDAITRSPKTP